MVAATCGWQERTVTVWKESQGMMELAQAWIASEDVWRFPEVIHSWSATLAPSGGIVKEVRGRHGRS